MKRFLTFLVTFVLLTVSAQPFAAQAPRRNRPLQTPAPRFRKVENALSGQYIVILRDNTPRSEVSSLANTLARDHGATLEYVYTDVFKGFSVKNMSDAQARRLSQDQRVKTVDENGRPNVNGQQLWPFEDNVIKPLDRIDQRVGLDGQYNYPRTGTGVHVYIVDTGVWIQHNDFGGRAAALWDFQPSSSIGGYATGEDVHGTLVASAVGSKTWGVAKNCLLYFIHVAADSLHGLRLYFAARIEPDRRHAHFRTPAVLRLSQPAARSVRLGFLDRHD